MVKMSCIFLMKNYLARIVLHRNMTLATKASVGNVYS